jgi:transposase
MAPACYCSCLLPGGPGPNPSAKRSCIRNMLQLVPQLRILLAVHPTDFRKGLDSLVALCRGPLQQDPFSGALFVFRNRTGTALKLVVYDGIGFWLCVRRFSSGKLSWWPAADTPLHPLTAPQLMVLLYQGHPELACFAPPWRALG